MAFTAPPRQQPGILGTPRERLDYLIEMIRQLEGMAAVDHPSVSRHLKAAVDEATRLARLRG